MPELITYHHTRGRLRSSCSRSGSCSCSPKMVLPGLHRCQQQSLLCWSSCEAGRHPDLRQQPSDNFSMLILRAHTHCVHYKWFLSGTTDHTSMLVTAVGCLAATAISSTKCAIATPQDALQQGLCCIYISAPVQLALLLSHTQPAEQLQAYPVEGAGRSTHDPLTALAWLLQGLPWQASRSAGGSSNHRIVSSSLHLSLCRHVKLPVELPHSSRLQVLFSSHSMHVSWANQVPQRLQKNGHITTDKACLPMQLAVWLSQAYP
jgi:hypothetical protein